MEKSNRHRINRRELLRNLTVLGAASLAGWHAPAGASPTARSVIPGTFIDRGELTFALSSSDLAAVQPLLNDYTARTGTTIKTVVDTYSNIYTKISISLTQSTGAFDLVSLDDPWIPQFAGGKFLVNLTERMERDGVLLDPDFLPELLRLGEYPAETGLRGMPWIGNVQLFTWRQDIFDEMGLTPPSTWEEVLAIAARITEERGGSGLYGFGLRGKGGNPASTSFLPILRGFGKDLIDPVTNEPQLASREALAAIELHLSLKAHTPPGPEKTGHVENGQNLLSGVIAMSADIWPDQLFRTADSTQSAVAGMVAFGVEPAEHRFRTSSVNGNWLLAIPEGSKNVERAAEFMYWFTEPEQQKRLLLESYVSPTRTSVMNDPDAIAVLPFLPEMLKMLKRGRPRLRTPYYRAIDEICGIAVADAIAGRQPGDEAMIKANADIRALLVREGVLT